MSIATITAAQRVEARDECLRAALALQRFAQSGTTPRTDETAEVTPILEAAAAALVVAGASGLAATSTVVTNGQDLTGVTPSGTYTDTVTFTVAGGVITAIVLS